MNDKSRSVYVPRMLKILIIHRVDKIVACFLGLGILERLEGGPLFLFRFLPLSVLGMLSIITSQRKGYPRQGYPWQPP